MYSGFPVCSLRLESGQLQGQGKSVFTRAKQNHNQFQSELLYPWLLKPILSNWEKVLMKLMKTQAESLLLGAGLTQQHLSTSGECPMLGGQLHAANQGQ